MKKLEKRWRAEKGKPYWCMDKDLNPLELIDSYTAWHDIQYEHKNYFETKELLLARIEIVELKRYSK